MVPGQCTSLQGLYLSERLHAESPISQSVSHFCVYVYLYIYIW